MHYLGVDTGGTFTDFVVFDRRRQQFQAFKVRSVPGDPATAIEAGLVRLRDVLGIDVSSIERFIFGTTVATNAVLERKGADSVLLTTRGMRDVLEIQRQWRHRLFDLELKKPPPLIARRKRFDVDERIASDGRVVAPLSAAEIDATIERLGDTTAQSVAVCFLFSFLAPGHERALGQAINARLPHLLVSLSSDVCPEFREYERTATTVMNAYTMPTLEALASRLATVLDDAGFSGSFGVIQSNGGIARLERARRLPVTTLLSGPAAGVVGAVEVAKCAGAQNILAFDIGGTSTDITLIEEAEVRLTSSGVIAGYPVKIPQVPVHTIGAGGGSIARAVLGLLKVGPDSAGATPGPVCYGSGGSEPTGTDAAVALGYIDPENFLGGEMLLDRDAALRAIEEKVAVPLGLSVEQASLSILNVQAANIVSGIRQVSVEVGKDARDFTLLPFGGAGGVYAGLVAREAGISSVLIPTYPSVLSALGMLVTDVRFDRSQTHIAAAETVDPAQLAALYTDLANGLRKEIEEERGFTGTVRFEFSCDLRYVGQAYEITVRLNAEQPGFEPQVDAICTEFHEQHRRLYGQSSPSEPVEFVNLRTGLIGGVDRASLRRIDEQLRSTAVPDSRSVLFREDVGWLECAVHNRQDLDATTRIRGPAIVEESGSAIVLHPGDELSVDSYGNLLVDITP